MALFSELKRRNVLRVAAAYVAVGWLVIQVIETLFPVFGLSDGAIRAVVILLAIGFVPVVALAWAFELTPDGLLRDSEVDRTSPTRQAMGKRLDRLFMIALALALGYFALDKFMLDPARDRAREQEIAKAAKEEGRAEAVRESQDAEATGPPIVAVLPFAAVGGGEDSAFFAAGVHDDLLTQLAQQPSMRVISRTSVLEYRGTEKNIREIGEELRADAILEGGVQSAGNRIRINAQLIDARTDEHLWAETFDRELTASNIFDVQTEIARAISVALHGTLSVQIETELIPTTNMAAYRLYHEALEMPPKVFSNEAYRGLLREAAELDPTYTRPQAELVGSLALDLFDRENQATIVEAEQVLANIATVAPGSADHLIAQAYYTYYILEDYNLAHELASRAQTLRPSDARLAQMKSWIERRQGDYGAMVESIRLARQLDPRNPRWTGSIIFNLFLDHRYDEAWAEYETIDEPGYWETLSGIHLRHLRAMEHRDFGRLAADLQTLHDEFDGAMPVDNLVLARMANREYAAAAELLDQMPDPVAGDYTDMGIPNKTLLELQIRWFQGQSDRLEALVRDARVSLENRVSDGWLSDAQAMLGAAYLAAVQGDSAEAVRLVRGWNREGAARDPPERAFRQDTSCRILGMVGAAEEAVACIRIGLAVPSLVVPAFEIYLPHYDSIRDEPVFVELVAELEAGEH